MKKRLIAALLTLCMIFSLMPVSVFAAAPTPLVQIGDTEYMSLPEALEAAQDGDTIRFLGDPMFMSKIIIKNKSLTFDLDGHAILLKGYQSGLFTESVSGMTLTIKNGTVYVENKRAGFYTQGTLRLINTRVSSDGDGVVTRCSNVYVDENSSIEAARYAINNYWASNNTPSIIDIKGRLTSEKYAVYMDDYDIIFNAYEGSVINGKLGALNIQAHPAQINISGGTFGDNFLVLNKNPDTSKTDEEKKISVNITGGEFNGAIVSGKGSGLKAGGITGGFFAEDPTEYLAEGYAYRGSNHAVIPQSVAHVEALINDIGEVTYTPECKAKITAAKDAYNALPEEEQAMVINMDVYYAADNAYRDLEMAYGEEMAKVMPLVKRVADLGDITLEDKAEIEAIRAAYNALIPDAQHYFQNFYDHNYLTDLEDAEAQLAALEKVEADKAAAKAVEDKINAIGKVEYTPECKARITAAKDAYNALTEEQQALVTNMDVYYAADNAYRDLEMAHGAEMAKVMPLIQRVVNLGDITLEDKAEIEAIRTVYNELIPDAQNYFQNFYGHNYLTDLEDAEAQLAALEKAAADQAAADEVMALIDAIGEVEYTPECKAKITAAKNAYNALTEEQQALVTNMDVYYAADNAYRDLEMAHGAEMAKVMPLIQRVVNLGDITLEDKAEIEAIRTAYNELIPDAQNYFQNFYGHNYLTDLEDAEAQLAALEKAAADQAAADEVMALIDAIGEVEYTPECKAKITAAKNAYNALTEEQQALVTNMDVYYAADNAYRDLEMEYHAEMSKVMPLVQRVVNLGDITLEDEAAIKSIRTDYDALKPFAQDYFQNYYGHNYLTDLENAEAKLADLKKVAEVNGVKYDTLEEAVAAAQAGETVTLLRDAEVGPNYILVTENITIDLAGHTVTSNNTIYTYNGATIKNGSIVATAKGVNPIYANGGKLKLNNLKIDSNASAVYIADGEVTIDKDCVFTLAETAAEPVVTVFGTNADAYPKAIVSGKLDASKTANCAALQGNGSDASDPWMEIKDGAQLISNATAIYKPNGGTLYITGGTITGSTAVEVRAGTLNVRGGTLTSTAEAFEKAPNGNGATMDGAAIAVSQHNTNKDISIVIWKGTFNGPYALYEEDLQDTQSDNIDFSVHGGTFNGKFYTQNATKFAKGGDFAEEPAAEYLVDGYCAQETSEGRFIVGKAPVAMIGDDRTYPTLQDAVTAAQSGDTVKLIADIELTRDYGFEQICVTTKMTLDFNGHTVTSNHAGKNNSAVLFVNAGGDLTLTGEGGINVLNGGYCVHVNGADAVVNVESGTYHGAVTAVNIQQGTANIKGGSFSVAPTADGKYDYLLNCIDSAYTDGSAKFVVTGGTFEKFNPAASNGEPNGPVDLVASGYESVADGENFIVKQIMVAEVNGTQYPTLQEAVAAAAAGDTVKLINNAATNDPVVIDKKMTLDMNGMTITFDGDAGEKKLENGYLNPVSGADLTITGNGTITYNNSDNYTLGMSMVATGDAKVTIENGTFHAGLTAVQIQDTVVCNIKGGTFKADFGYNNRMWILNKIDRSRDTAVFNVTGGTFCKFDPSMPDTENPADNFVAIGYEAVKEGDNYIVQVNEAVVCYNKETKTEYATVSEAIAAAQAGQTIVMLKDVRDNSYIVVYGGITLDLNGKKLTAAGLNAFSGNNVIDNSCGNGKLIVNGNNIAVAKDNPQLPIYTDEGYFFVPMEMRQTAALKVGEDGIKFGMLPVLNHSRRATTPYFGDGVADNFLQIGVRMTWTRDDGTTAAQDYIFSEDLIRDGYSPRKQLNITITGVANLQNFKVFSFINSVTGTECTGSNVALPY